jgi:uncharacterized protein
LIDEKKGRRKLEQLRVKKIGMLGILLKAKGEELVAAIRPDIERLRRQGFSISQDVVDQVLQQAKE